MSYMNQLLETYDACYAKFDGLLPVCHTVQQAHVEIVIDDKGNFRRASIIDGIETIIPATESSSGRTNSPVPHALCDKLLYVARDYPLQEGSWTNSFGMYLHQLELWCEKYPHPKAIAILTYVRQGHLVADLVNTKVLFKDANNELLLKWNGTNRPRIFEVLPQDAESGSAFIRWRVETPGILASGTWEDASLIESWQQFELGRQSVKGVCVISGQHSVPLAQNHPCRLRSGADRAKLLSSNDAENFTFRGRFFTPEQAATVSLQTTQKAHSALRWLINRQAYRHGTQAILAWAVSGASIPDMLGDSVTLFGGCAQNGSLSSLSPPQVSPQITIGDIGQLFAEQLARAIAGYKINFRSGQNIVVLGLDSASPGRMAITFYRELPGSEFLDRLLDWHKSFAWCQRYASNFSFVGVAAPKDIAAACYGRRIDEKLSRATVERILPCIIDARPIPNDLVRSVMRRASQRSGADHWDWEKSLGIACSLFKGSHKKRNYSMALETNRRTRDYLYGRLLATAEYLEKQALDTAGEERDTTAARSMQRFSDRPFSTWLNVEKTLQPYKSRLRVKSAGTFFWITALLDEIHSLFEPSDYTNDSPLSGEYLLGYHCQRRSFSQHRQDVKNIEQSDMVIDE